MTRTGSTTGGLDRSYAVTGSGANPATAADFAGGVLPTGTVSFAAGETSKTITVNVAGDSTVEAGENFTVDAVQSERGHDHRHGDGHRPRSSTTTVPAAPPRHA